MNEEIIILDFSSQSVFIETLTDEKRKEIADENEIDAEELYCEWEIILEAL